MLRGAGHRVGGWLSGSQVGNADTSAAFDFHNQLTAAQLLLGIETGDASFRIGRLREYLAKNY